MGLFSKAKKSAAGTPEITDDSPYKGDSYLNTSSYSEGTSTRPFGFESDIPEEKEAFVSSRPSASSSSLKQCQSVEDRPKKKSLYQRWQDAKRGPGTSEMSDEDFLKYTGKNRAEFDQWAATTPGVAGGQAAGSLTAGGTSGFGIAGGADEGLGGWGIEAGKYPTVR
ncbi:hypothetical protein LTR70_001561 [Exophiala xenobiotica]|uniref:Uncharacterized protein n=1 Tax=Lithohypha guttulata TaxID=1690604 RepID=A0ABR0KDL7_9EURO|nr:hypothetical protein LTR24_003994 [Lithohypha guttulata]KAK5327938.1 hypothetical protein LTR70_001561 [Exophiala xenobiotica]